jgi:hypothetical protein
MGGLVQTLEMATSTGILYCRTVLYRVVPVAIPPHIAITIPSLAYLGNFSGGQHHSRSSKNGRDIHDARCEMVGNSFIPLLDGMWSTAFHRRSVVCLGSGSNEVLTNMVKTHVCR